MDFNLIESLNDDEVQDLYETNILENGDLVSCMICFGTSEGAICVGSNAQYGGCKYAGYEARAKSICTSKGGSLHPWFYDYCFCALYNSSGESDYYGRFYTCGDTKY